VQGVPVAYNFAVAMIDADRHVFFSVPLKMFNDSFLERLFGWRPQLLFHWGGGEMFRLDAH
jgi:hypothetical protein